MDAGGSDNLDRRPIAARRLGVFRSLSRGLAAARVTPNAISTFGMLAGILAGASLAATAHVSTDWVQRGSWLAGAALIQLRLVCNLIDGMVAVEGGLRQPTGDLYNDAPDRISDAAGLVGLGYAVQSNPELGYLAALVAVLTAYVRVLGKAVSGESDYRGPMAKQQRMFLVTVCAVYLALTPSVWHPVIAPEQGWGLPACALAVIVLGGLFTSLRRIGATAQRLRASGSSGGSHQ